MDMLLGKKTRLKKKSDLSQVLSGQPKFYSF